MKKIIALFSAVLILVGIGIQAEAALIDLGDNLIFDDVNDIYWYQNLDDFINQTYSQQLTAIANLSGTGWHMATSDEMEALWAYDAYEIAGLFNSSDPGDVFEGGEIWNGRYDLGSGENSHYIVSVVLWDSGLYTKGSLPGTPYGDSTGHDYLGAWVASDSHPFVPEPGTFFLIGSGLLGLMGIRLRSRRNQ